MEGPVALVAALTVTSVLLVWRFRSKPPVWASRRVRGEGRSAITAKMTFVVPGTGAAEVVRTIVARLGYPTEVSVPSSVMVLLAATSMQADFALASQSGRAWESRLVVGDRSGGAHGQYEVIRWTVVDGVAAGWREAETVERGIGRIVTSIGGTVKITVAE